MKKRLNQIIIFLAIGALSLNQSWAHDLKMAFFEFTESTRGIVLQLTFDKDDLALSLTKINPELEGEKDLKVWEQAAKAYLTTHFKLKLNQAEMKVSPTTFGYDKDYVRIEMVMDNVPAQVKTIDIWSDCLIADIKGQSNIVKSKLNGKTRTFRLNKKRTSIKIDY